MLKRFAAVMAVFLISFAPASADEPKVPAEFAALEYRLVGPYAGGRVSRACAVAGDPLTYYAATASGGVWKSSDGGLNWKPIFDDQRTSSIGSIAVASSDPNVVYVGTGEANIRGNVSPGAGIFKSEDAGKTWKHVWKQVGQIGTIVVHPTNPDVCYAAVLGHAFGPNPERGVYRTLDGGRNWENVLFKNNETGCSDIAIDPNNPRILFAGFWQTRRRPWDMTSGGPGGDFFVSRDAGETWTSLRDLREPNAQTRKSGNGLPPGLWGKIGVAVAPSDSNRIYALIEAEKGGLFRSDDGGETWKLTSDDRTLRQRAWYYSTLTVHPLNPDLLYAPNVPMLKSINGGSSFSPVRGPHHGDYHDMWIDPANPNRMICANDGGVDISTDGGQTWYAPPLPITQFYHVHADNSVPYRVMGCMQDLGSASGPSNSLKGRIGLGDWYSVGGGEAGHCVSDPKDPNIVYAGEYGGIMTRYDHRTRQARNITVNQWNPSGIDPAKHKYRFQWTAPILVSRHTGAVYHAGNFLFRTTDQGATWQKVSPDLTRNDKQKQQWSGGPITGDNTGAETYCTIFAIAESPKQKGLMWTGSDDGKVFITRDDCKTWTDVTPKIPDLPDWGTVTCIEASPHDAGTAFLVVDNHRMDDFRPHVWKTTNFGMSWTKIVDGLDEETHVKVVREDPKKKGLLYLGSERGLSYSTNAGATWEPLQLNLPTVPVHDLQVKDNDLVVGTHGRSIWILDDLTVIRAMNPAIKSKAVHLYPVSPSVKWRGGGGGVSSYDRGSSTRDPDRGAVIWYSFAKVPAEATLEILSSDGKTIAKAKGKQETPGGNEDEDKQPRFSRERKLELKQGLNKFVWDYTHDGAKAIPGAQVDAGFPGMGIPVTPGTYTAKLTIGKQSFTTPVIVKPDPRIDLKAISKEQESFALGIRDQITSLTEAVLRIRSLQKQIALRKELFKENAKAKDLLKAEAEFSKKLTAVEEKLHNPKAKIVYDIFAARGGAMLYSQFTWLLGNVTETEGPPTQPQRELLQDLTKQLNQALSGLEKLTKDELSRLSKVSKDTGVPELYVP